MARVLFFDGYCSLCNGIVSWMMSHDHRRTVSFASLQGKTAKTMLPPERLKEGDPDSVIYMRDGVLYDQSTAVLMAFKDLGGIWPLTSVFFVIPAFLRNIGYRIVAGARYKLFKRRDTCRMPTPEERERFLP